PRISAIRSFVAVSPGIRDGVSNYTRAQTTVTKTDRQAGARPSQARGDSTVEDCQMSESTPLSPASHAAPLILSFYGDGETLIGEALFDFFNTVAIFGRRTELCRIMTEY